MRLHFIILSAGAFLPFLIHADLTPKTTTITTAPGTPLIYEAERGNFYKLVNGQWEEMGVMNILVSCVGLKGDDIEEDDGKDEL